jgi:hypothetical protein
MYSSCTVAVLYLSNLLALLLLLQAATTEMHSLRVKAPLNLMRQIMTPLIGRH